MSNIITRISEPDKPHHITCVVRELLPVFSQPEAVRIVFDSWQQLRKNYGLRLYGYIVMEEHLHFLAQAGHLDECLVSFMADTEKRIIEFLEERRMERFLKRLANGGSGAGYGFWQEEPELEMVTGDEMMRRTVDYIHINPVKRGYVDRTVQWRYSSARNYAGEAGMIEIDRWE